MFDEILSKGIRLTSQRRALIGVIQEAKAHLDAGSLLELARQREPGIDRATVYRTLELLKKLRLIDELDLMHLEGEKLLRSKNPKGARPSGRFSLRPDSGVYEPNVGAT